MNNDCKHSPKKITHNLFFVSILLLITACTSEIQQPLIALNLVGYNSDQIKQAFLVNTKADEFEIIQLDGMNVVFSDAVGGEKKSDLATGDRLSILDFTGLKAEGEYIIRVVDKDGNGTLDQLHYILGRNPFGISLVTGAGSQSAQHPYHQFSKMGGFKEPVPGLVVGGPNNHVPLEKIFLGPGPVKYPGKNYEDQFENYLVNEVAINFTAVFLFVAGSHVVPPNI